VVSSTPRPHFTLGKDPVPILQGALWPPGPVWTRAENLIPTGIRYPDRPARSSVAIQAELLAPHIFSTTCLKYLNCRSLLYPHITCKWPSMRYQYECHEICALHQPAPSPAVCSVNRTCPECYAVNRPPVLEQRHSCLHTVSFGLNCISSGCLLDVEVILTST